MQKPGRLPLIDIKLSESNMRGNIPSEMAEASKSQTTMLFLTRAAEAERYLRNGIDGRVLRLRDRSWRGTSLSRYKHDLTAINLVSRLMVVHKGLQPFDTVVDPESD